MKATNAELAEARTSVNELTSINAKANAEKRHIESAVHTKRAEIEDLLRQAKSSEEKSKKAMVDAGRLADELRCEQEHVHAAENAKRALEGQIAELEHRLVEANEAASRGGRSALSRLESRIRELEIEVGGCQSKSAEMCKAYQKAERRIKELQFQQDEDHKNQVYDFNIFEIILTVKLKSSLGI